MSRLACLVPFVVPLLMASLPMGTTCAALEAAGQALDRGDAAAARDAVRPCLVASPHDGPSLLVAARASLGLADVDAAVRLLELAVATEPGRPDYHRWLAHAYGLQARGKGLFAQVALGKKAVAELEVAVRQDPDDLDSRVELIDFHASAPRLFGGDRDKAAAEAQEIARRDALRGLQAEARLALASGDAAAAEQRLELAVARFPERFEGPLWLGSFFLRRQGPAKAVPPFERALALAPEAPVASYGLGAALAASDGDPERAEALLRRYLAHLPGPGEPSRADALYHLALVHRRLGKVQQARSELSEALRFDPEHGAARRAAKELEKP